MYRVADFFCGGGGFSEGFKLAGFKIAFAVDKWQPAVTTHHANHPNAKEIAKVISPLIDEDILLCTDGNRIYQVFAKTLKLTHKIINASAGEYIKEGANALITMLYPLKAITKTITSDNGKEFAYHK